MCKLNKVDNDSLISQLFIDSQAQAIKSLYKSGERNLILDAIAEKLINSKNLVISLSLNQLILICNLNKQIIEPNEPITVATSIMYILKISNPFPSLSEHRGLDFAFRALICLGFFPQAMDYRTRHFAYPDKNYYKNVMKIRFSQHNLDNLAKSSDGWIGFIQEFFVN